MDFSAIIGIVAVVVLTIFGILSSGGNLLDYYDLPSLLITVFPTFFSLLTCFPPSQLAKVPKHFGIIMGRQKYDPAYYITTLYELSKKARSSGLIALEQDEANISDPFFASAVGLIVDGHAPDKLMERLSSKMASITERHAQAWAIYDKGAAFGPAFGMIGTVLGLIAMLLNLNFSDAGGIATLGKNMSVALITTFYGSLLANVFFMPLGSKLRARHQEEMFCKKLVIEGVMSIQRGDNPMYTYDMLLERLSPKMRSKIAK